MKIYIFLIGALLILLSCSENTTNPDNGERIVIGIDTVYAFSPASDTLFGRDYFPYNIYGMPDVNASEYIPSNNPNQILSLGLSGEIIIGFKDYYIIDKTGIDFIVFENAFVNPLNGNYYAEPAEISVSADGVNFVSFVFDSLTLQGCAGVTPTYGDPRYPLSSGGDKYDLNDIGFDSIICIKIKDISSIILNNPKHPFYDITINGFDLDAVVGINFEPKK